LLDAIKRSLGAKIVIAVGAVMIFFVAVSGYLDYRNESRETLELYRRNARILANTIEKSFISAMKEGRGEDVQKVMEDLGTQEEILEVRIFSQDGKVLRSTDPDEIGKMVDRETLDLYKGAEVEGAASTEGDGMVLHFLKPIYNGPQCFGCHGPDNTVNGVLNVKVSMERAYASISKNKAFMAKLGVLSVLLVVLAQVLLMRQLVTKRVENLRKAMRKAESGEEFEIQKKYNDEIGELGSVFEAMMERITKLNADAIEHETELARNQEQIRSQSILGSIIDGMPDGVAIIDRDMLIVQTNPSHKELFPDAKVGEPCYFCIHKRDTICPHCGLVKVFEDGEVHDHHSTIQLSGGVTKVVHSISAPIRDEQGNIIRAVEVVRDVTERVNLEREIKEKSWELERANKKLAKMAVTDGLTMLFNRRYFQDSLAREFKRLDRHRALPLLALAMIDLDNFKNLNDNYGHQAGDQVLRALGKILKATIRMTDIVARYGGEEFVIIMPETDREGMLILAERIRSTIEETKIEFNDLALNTTVSIGLASYPSDYIRSEDDLVKAADDALYKAKDAGKNTIIEYGQEEAV